MKDAHLSTADAHDIRKWRAGISNLTARARKEAATDTDSDKSIDNHSDGPTEEEEEDAAGAGTKP